MVHTKLNLDFIYLLMIIFMCYACQNDEEEENTFLEERAPDIQIDDEDKDSLPKDFLKHRYFVYGLGCSWDSQSKTKGKLVFEGENKFRFELDKVISKKRSEDNPDHFIFYGIRKEVIEGDFIFKSREKEVEFEIKNYQVTDENQKVISYEIPEEKSFLAILDSCQDKLTLSFMNPIDEIPSEKYYQWVEKNLSGSFVSYAEGVREELIIKDSLDNLKVYYKSPSHETPIKLIVSNLDRDTEQFDVKFSTNETDRYRISIYNKELWSLKSGDHFPTSNQKFVRLWNDNIDNPNDLSLQIKGYDRSPYRAGASFDIDTSVVSSINIKVEIEGIAQQIFQEYNYDSDFENLIEENCPDEKGTYYRETPCVSKVEKTLLNQSSIVSREQEYLIFNLVEGQPYFLRNNITGFSDTQRFCYRGKKESSFGNIFLVAGFFYESWRHFSIHQDSQEVISFSSEATISPDGKYIIAYDNIGQYEMDGVKIQLWEIKPYGFDLVWEYLPPYIPGSFSWIDANSLIFNIVSTDVANEDLAYAKMVIVE